MNGKNLILDKIMDMKEEFNIIKETYTTSINNDKMENLINKINFMENKLDILKIAILDEGARQHCIELKESIDEFKLENSILDYQYKLDFIKGLDELVATMDYMKNWELVNIIEGLFSFVHLNKTDMQDLNYDRKVYLNKLGTIDEYNQLAGSMDPDERFSYARDLLENLLDFTLESYNENIRPLDLYEKIMIINILDAGKFYLKYKEE